MFGKKPEFRFFRPSFSRLPWDRHQLKWLINFDVFGKWSLLLKRFFNLFMFFGFLEPKKWVKNSEKWDFGRKWPKCHFLGFLKNPPKSSKSAIFSHFDQKWHFLGFLGIHLKNVNYPFLGNLSKFAKKHHFFEILGNLSNFHKFNFLIKKMWKIGSESSFFIKIHKSV